MNEWLRKLLYLPPQASDIARSIDTLHYFVISATMAGSTAVFLIALWFLARHRRRGPATATPRVSVPRWLEALLITGTLGLFLVFWVIGFSQYNHLNEAPRDAMTVHVTARQWMWRFTYPDGASSLGTLTVPLGRAVRLVMTSRDVIHSFYVPAFRIKQDVVPGRYVTSWFRAVQTGSFELLCAEYCGLSHSRMLARVEVLGPREYAAWLSRTRPRARAATPQEAESPAALASGMADYGRQVAVRQGCLACHTVDGQRHIGPTWKGLFGARVTLQTGATVLADEAYLTRSMMDPEVDVVAGFEPIMPTFRGVLSTEEVAALLEYMRALAQGGPSPSVALPPVPAAVAREGSAPAPSTGSALDGATIPRDAARGSPSASREAGQRLSSESGGTQQRVGSGSPPDMRSMVFSDAGGGSEFGSHEQIPSREEHP